MRTVTIHRIILGLPPPGLRRLLLGSSALLLCLAAAGCGKSEPMGKDSRTGDRVAKAKDKPKPTDGESTVGAPPGAHRPNNEPGPVKAVPGIVKLFETYSVVAIGEFHGYAELGDLYTALVRDRAFQAKVNDIVIEFASRHNQPILDRYVLQCEDLPLDELRRVWRDTSKATHSWESPLYTGWLAAIRDANQNLPAARRMRVLAGDTPVDWARLKTHEDWLALGASDVSFAKVVNEEVLDKKRKALLVLGAGHLARDGGRLKQHNTTTRIAKAHAGAIGIVFVFGSIPPLEYKAGVLKKMADWEIPSLFYPLKGTWLGKERWLGRAPLDQVADGLLYVGPPGTQKEIKSRRDTIDKAYFKELQRRALIQWGSTKPVEVLRPR
ncbi:MAG TPA: hypothetical protein VG013_03820 [Gemmataceae bacterium]|nr:hypothetical protein [Gemmataceae bacterium]